MIFNVCGSTVLRERTEAEKAEFQQLIEAARRSPDSCGYQPDAAGRSTIRNTSTTGVDPLDLSALDD